MFCYSKANELMRLLKMKSLGGNAITLSDSAQSVICLDLASSSIGISFDVVSIDILYYIYFSLYRDKEFSFKDSILYNYKSPLSCVKCMKI